MLVDGIDVSMWQGNIDWEAVSGDWPNFAIIKAGGSDDGFYTDPKFEENYWGATRAGLGVGAYYFVGPKCNTYMDGVADARRFIDIIKGKKFSYPVYVDMETNDGGTPRGKTDALIGFCETMEDAGYYVGIYGSEFAGFQGLFIGDDLTAYDFWVANWSKVPELPHGMWQSTSCGKVYGIWGDVDTDVATKDYPSIMVQAGLNGY